MVARLAELSAELPAGTILVRQAAKWLRHRDATAHYRRDLDGAEALDNIRAAIREYLDVINQRLAGAEIREVEVASFGTPV